MKDKKKKQRLKRKDKFKEIKKGAIPMSIAPAFLTNEYGVTKMSDNGINQVDNEMFTKLYEVTIHDEKTSAKELFDLLRNYDIDFRVHYISDKIYIEFMFIAKNIDDAWADSDKFEKDIYSKINQLNIGINALDFESRMAFTNVQLSDDADIGSYKDKNSILAWKDNFSMKNIIEDEENEVIENEDKSLYKVAYIQKFSDKSSEFIDEIKKIKNVKNIMFEFGPIADSAARVFLDENYMEYESVIKRSDTKDPELYQLYEGDKKDKRIFTACGVMLLLKIEEMEDIEVVMEKVAFIATRYDIKISYIHVGIKEAFKQFLALGRWNVRETRTVRSKEAHNLLFPAYLKNIKEDESVDDFFFDINQVTDKGEETSQYDEFNEFDDEFDEYDESEE